MRESGIVVVKLGGRTQADPALPGVLAALWGATGGQLVLVHGGGDQISALQRLGGEEPTFIGGRRVTTPMALELVRMVLSGLANKELVSALNATAVPAVGISGEDGALLSAEAIDVGTFGFSGTPVSVDPRVVETLLSAGFLPVISPVARNADWTVGGALNVNGDDAAAAIATRLGATELFFLADVAGVLDAHDDCFAALTVDDAQQLVASGVVGGGMAAKLDAGHRALLGGVSRVRIGDLAALTAPGAGTHLIFSFAGRS